MVNFLKIFLSSLGKDRELAVSGIWSAVHFGRQVMI